MEGSLKEDLAAIPGIGDMQLALDKDESKRAMALLLAIRYHTETIIKDPEYLKTMIQYEEKMKFSNDPDKEMWHLKPTTVAAVIHIGNEFYSFITGGKGFVDGKEIAGIEINDSRLQGER